MATALGIVVLLEAGHCRSRRRFKSGLLQHSFFVPAHFSQSGHEEKYGDKESNDLFWMIGPDDQPAPFERLPLGFVLRRLWLYFDNQFDRFANTLAREQPENTSLTRLELAREPCPISDVRETLV